jgi:hypothetical protein
LKWILVFLEFLFQISQIFEIFKFDRLIFDEPAKLDRTGFVSFYKNQWVLMKFQTLFATALV